MNLGEILANAVINRQDILMASKGCNIAFENGKADFQKMSKDVLIQVAFDMAVELVNEVHELGNIRTFIEVSRQNMELLNEKKC